MKIIASFQIRIYYFMVMLLLLTMIHYLHSWRSFVR